MRFRLLQRHLLKNSKNLWQLLLRRLCSPFLAPEYSQSPIHRYSISCSISRTNWIDRWLCKQMIFLASNSSGPDHGLGGEDGRVLGRVCPQVVFTVSSLPNVQSTPSLNDKIDSGKSHLQDLARWLRTSQRVDIPKISQFYWALFEKTRFLYFYIIKSMARKGYFGHKSDFRGSKIPPRGASSTWNM